MAFTPISGTLPQYNKADGTLASGYFLKFYNTSNAPINMYSASDGSGSLIKAELDSSGYPQNGSDDPFTPYIDQEYKLALYTNATDADANTTANADWFVGPFPQPVVGAVVEFFLSSYTDLDTAISSIGATEGTLVIDKNDTVSTTETVPSTLNLDWIQGNVLTVSGSLTINSTIDAGEYHIFTVNGTLAGLEKNGTIVPQWFSASADIGVQINAATSASFTRLFLSPGSYTQSTALTANQEVHLYSSSWDVFSTPPAIITKDADITCIETTATFTSLGIEWNGGSVAGGKDGLIMHSKFIFIGRVTAHTGNGLVIDEASASHNSNNSIVGGAFSGNTKAQLVVSASKGSGTNDIDVNTIQFLYCRCNSGRFGLHVKAGLFNDYQYVNAKGNSEIGVFIEAENVISANTFRLYSENSASDSTDFFAVDGWAVFGSAPTRTGATTFTLVGDQTATFAAEGKIRCVDNSVNFYGTIDSAVFSSVTTVTVTLFGTANVLTANLTQVSTDAANNDFADNQFIEPKGLTVDDIYPENSNIFKAGSAIRGIITNNQQPWAAYYGSAAQSNVTGNGVTYTVLFDTKIKDTQNNFVAATSIFTSPTSGCYRATGCIRFEGLGATAHTRSIVTLVTTNRTYTIDEVDIDAVKSAGNIYSVSWGVDIDMDSLETAKIQVRVFDNGQDVDLSGDATNAQTFCSYRLEG